MADATRPDITPAFTADEIGRAVALGIGAIRLPFQLYPLTKQPAGYRGAITALHGGHLDITTKTGWDGYRWNPPQGWPYLTRADDNAAPKPTWEQVYDWTLEYRLRNYELRNSGWTTAQSTFNLNVDAIANAPVSVDSVGSNIHTGSGISRLGGLVHKHANAGVPGQGFTRSVMRTPTHETRHIWTTGHLQDLLAAAMLQHDETESARNIVLAQLQALQNKVDDSTLSLAERHNAMAEIRTIAADPAAAIETARTTLRSETLPTDVNLAREVLNQRLEAASAEQRAFILGASDRQGALVYSSCTEQLNALKSIALLRQEALIDLMRETTVAAMLTRATTAIDQMRAARVVNSPAWRDGTGANLTLTGDSYAVTYTYSAANKEVAVIRAVSASLSGGKAAIESAVGYSHPDLFEHTLRTVASDKNAHEVVITYTGAAAPPAGSEYDFEFIARNKCGPSKLTMTVSTPAAEAQGDTNQ